MKNILQLRLSLTISFVFVLWNFGLAADQVVTTNANSGAGSLRQAITDVTSGGTITFNLSAGNETITLSSELGITKALTIDGTNSAGSGVDVTVKVTTPGSSAWRVFNINASGSTINLQNMTMLGGSTGGSYGGVMRIESGTSVNLSGITMSNGKSNYGGGVFLTGSTTNLTVTNSTLSNNSTTSQHGGWIYNEGGNVTVTSCTFSGNTGVCGGAIFNAISYAKLTVSSCEFTGNTANGGAIYNEGTATISGSTLYSNTSTSIGGAITSWGAITVTSSTISGNTATTDGGGIYKGGANNLIITSSTISGNASGSNKGGGIYNTTGNSYLLNSIIINNTASTGADLYNASGSTYAYYCWYNGTSGIISTQATAPNVTTAYVSGNLGALTNNGGSTKTMAVSPSSPAPDNGTFVYYNATDGYYFLDNQATPVSHKLISWATSPTVLPANKITTDQRGTTIGNPPTIGSFYLIPVHVVSTGGTSSADYYTLHDAADAINAGTHTGTITITLLGSTVETSSAVFNASGSGSASYSSINIYPVASGLSVSGSLSAPIIDLNGADNITIDGRVNATGSTKDLVITNTSTSSAAGTSTIRFINDACSNTVNYCTLKGASTASTFGGVIRFATGISSGNDYNFIDNNNITNTSNSTRPGYGIISEGTIGSENSSNSITNNNIYDIFRPSASSFIVYLASNSNAWTISGNNIYETTSFASTSSVTYSVINIVTGAGHTVSSNHIGGSGPDCSGTWTKTGTFDNTLMTIYINSGPGTANEIQGNTISNINWSVANASWYGIMVSGTGTPANIGTTSGNIIGAATGNGSIVYSMNTPNAVSMFYGICIFSTGTISIQNNTVGAITTDNANSAYPANCYGIYKTGGGTTIISNNVIGSAVTANSINALSVASGSSQIVCGIISSGSGTNTFSGNTISKLTNGTTNSVAATAGLVNGITVTSGNNTVSNNTVKDLTIANANTAADRTASVSGIALNTASAGAQTVTGNTIYNLSNSCTSFAGNIIGLYYNGSVNPSTVSGNFIHSFTMTSPSTSANMYGIKIQNGRTTWSNNIINLGSNTFTNICGIYERGDAGNNNSLYFNTVYISGDVGSSTPKSYALFSETSTNTRNFRNNIFDNQRFVGAKSPGAVYSNYAAWFNYGVSTNLTLDNNDYYVSAMGSGALGYFNSADVTSLPLISGKDASSKSVDPGFASAGGTSAVNYMPSNLALIAAAGTGITTDYGSNSRSSTYPAMGAWEYNVSPYITVNATSGTSTANYLTLKAAFDAINGGTHQGTITVLIQRSTTETAAAVLNASSSPASYTSVNIYPTVTGLSVSGNLNTPLIDLNGATNVTIDGRVNASGSTKDLVIMNSSPNASVSAGISAIRFINDACSNTVKYCVVKGSSTATNGGIIWFATSTGTSGNDNNIIDHNDITNASDGNRPVNAIASTGTITRENSGNTISNNNIYDFLNRGTASYGINIGNNNTAWTLTDNSFYETASFVPTALVAYKVISITSGSTGTGFTISNNYIGGKSSACGGTAWTKTGAYYNDFKAINLNVGTALASSLQGNTIRNFDYTAGDWTGINADEGFVNIGNVTSNTIGAPTGNGSVTLTHDGLSNLYAIKIAGTGSVNVQNNNIGSVTVVNPFSSGMSTNFYGIYTSSSGATVISNNLIGSTDAGTSNSIYATNGACFNVQNVCGISANGSGSNTISGNTISKMTMDFHPAGPYNTPELFGISVDGSSTNTVSGNFISQLKYTGTSTPATIKGIWSKAGNTTISNNIITIDGYASEAFGLYDAQTTGECDFYFNTVYLAGTGGWSSCLYSKAQGSPHNYRNNILYNLRTGTGGTDYNIYLDNPDGDFPIPGMTCDYNDFHFAPGGYLGACWMGIFQISSLTDWQGTGLDANSKNINPLFANAGGPSAADYVPLATGLTAVTGTGITTDYGGSPRSLTTPVMGAWETLSCVNPTNGGTIASAQTICSGSTPSAFTSTAAPSGHTGTLEYKWQLSTTSSSTGFSDIASSNSATYAPGALSATTWFKRVARVNCKSDWTGAAESNVLQITVDPASVGGSIAGGTTVCSGTNSTTLTLSGHTGSVVKWQKSTDNWTTPVDVANTTTTLVVTDLTATTKFRAVVQSGVCSSTNSSDATVTVDPVSVGGSIAGGTTVCSGTNSTTLTLSGHTGTVVKWQKSTDNWTTPVDVANTTTTLITSNLTATTKYRAVVQSGVCSSTNSSDATITVDPVSVGGSIAGGTTVCSGSNSTTLTLSGHTGTVVKWQKSTDNWTTPVDVINTTTTLVATDLTATTKYRAVVQSGVCSSTNSSDATITVDPVSVGGSIAGGTTVCAGTNSTTLTLSGHTGSVLKWQYSTDNWTTPVDVINTTTTLVATDLTATTKYRAVVQSGVCSSTNSSDATITVDPVSVGGSIAGGTTVCAGTNSTTLTLSGHTGSVLKWQYSTDNWTTPVDVANTTTTLVATNLTATTKYLAVVQSGVCSSTNSSDATITVDPVSVGGSIAGGTTVCSGSNSTTLTLSGHTGTVVKWQKSTDNWTTPVDVANTTTTLVATNLTATTKYRAVVQSGVCSSTNSSDATITVDPVSVGGSIAGGTTVCAGTNSTTLTLSGHTGSVLKWQYSTDNWTTPVDVANTTTTLVATNLTATTKYRVVVQSGVCSSTNSSDATIEINPLGQVNQPSSQVVCNNTSTTTITFTTTNVGGTTTYAWTNDATSIGLAASGTGNIAGFTAVNTGTSPVSATIVVTPTFTNNGVSCAGPTKTFTITVNPTAQVNQPADQVVCNSGAATSIAFGTTNTGGTTTYSWTNDTPGIGLAASGTGNIASFTAINTGTSPVVATIVVTPTFTNGGTNCTGPTKTFTITVNPTAQVDQPADQVVCNAGATSAVTFGTISTGGTTSYAWTNDTPGIGLAVSGNGNIAAFTAVNTGTSPVVATIVVTPTFTNGGTSCTGPTKTFTITVNPTAQVNQPVDQVVCNAGATATVTFGTNNTGGTTTYTWTNSVSSIGLAASGTGNIASFTAINTGNSPVVATIVVTPTFTNNGVSCTGATKTFNITVNPTAQVNQPADQVVCNASATTTVTFGTINTGGTATYSWTNDTPGIGLAASGTGNIASFTAINTGTSPVIASIVVTPTFTSNGVNCTGPTKTFTITVNPTAQVNQPADQVVCNSGTTASVTFGTTNIGGTTTYSWTNTTTSIGLAASGTGNIASFTSVNTGTSPVIATIVVTPTFANGGTNCTGPTKTFTITVNPTAQVNQPADQVVCNAGATATVTFGTINTGGNTTYSWTNTTTSIGLAATGTGNIASFTAINTGTSSVTATIVVTPTFTNGGANCTGPTKTFTITVNPTAQVNQPADQVVCNASATTTVTFGTINTGGAATYSWTNDTPGIGLAASGTGNIASFTAINTGNSPVVATIVVTPTFTNGGTSCTGPTKTFTITVNPTGEVIQPGSQVVCNAATTTSVIFGTNNTGGTTTYSWTNDTPGIGLAASGTGNIASFTAVNTGTSPVIATIVVTPTFTNGGTNCTGPTKTFTINVNPTAQVNQPADQVVCNASATATVTFGTINTGGASTYSWTNSAPSIGLAASGTGNIASFTAINNGTSPVVATIVVTPTFTNGGTNCTGPAKTFTITVNPTGEVIQPLSQVVCNAATTTSVIFGTNNTGGTTTYAWTNDTPGIGLAASGTGNIALFTAVNTGNNPVIATIVVTPTFTNNGVSCTGPTKTFTITVNPTAQVNQLADQVVCNAGATSTVIFGTTNIGGTTTYAWTNTTSSIGLAASGTGNIASFTAINTGTSPVIATIVVTPTFTNGGTNCTGPTKTFTITVNPTAQVNQAADQVVCNAGATSSVTFSTTNSGGTTTYAWTNSTTSIGLAATGTGNIASFTAINTGTSPVVATIVVTPTFINGGVSCQGPTKTFTISVNPTAQVNQPADQVVCNAGATATVAFSTISTGGTTTYAWTNTTTSIGLAASGTGNIASFTAINTGTSPVIATIVVSPTFTNGGTNCTGPTKTFTITVNPTAQVNQPADQVVCNASATATVTFGTINTGGIATYSWTNSAPSIGLAATGTGNIASFTSINNGTSPVIATIVVTPTFTNGGTNCTGPTKTFTITVNPTAQVIQPVSQVVCNTAVTASVIFGTNNTGGTTTYAWTNDTPGIGLAASGTGNIASFTAVNTGTSPVIATIVVTPTFTNNGVSCTGPTKTFTITVNPTAQVNQPTDQVVCNAGATTAVTFGTINTGGTTTYAWTNTTTSIGLAATGTGNIASFTAINAGTSPVIATIVVTPTFTNGGNNCSGPTKTFTITVNPTAQVNQPADQVVCNVGATATVTFGTTNTGGTSTYAWTNSAPSIGLAATGNGNIASFTAINNGNSPVIATIVVTPTFTNGGTNCTGPIKTFTITVNPTAQVNQPADQFVCNTASTTAVNFSTTNTGGTTTYAWTNTTTSIGLAASGTGNIASFMAVNNGTSPVVATIVVTPTFTNGGVSCQGPTKTFTITVNPTGQVNQPADQVVCNGAATSVIFGTINTGGNTTYAWTNNNPGIGLPPSGTGNISFNAINTGNSPVTVNFTVTPTFNNGSAACAGPTKNFIIIVNPSGQVNQPSNQLVCSNTVTQAVNFTTTTSGGTTTYAWTNSNPSIGLAASGTGNIPSFIAMNTGTTPVLATITVIPTFTNGSTGCAGPSKTFTITVNPLPVPTINGTTSMCPNSGNYDYYTEANMWYYQWNVSSGGVINWGLGTNHISVIWTTPGPQWVSVSYININGCAAAVPTILNVTVNPMPGNAGTITGTSAICQGTQGASYSVPPIANAISYIWTLPAGATIASGAGTNSITVNYPNNAVSGTVTVYGNNLCGNGTTSPPFTVTVSPVPSAAGTIWGKKIVCQGQEGVMYSVADISGATGYAWTVPAGATITSGANTNTITVSFALNATSGDFSVHGTNACGNGPESPLYWVIVSSAHPSPIIISNKDNFNVNPGDILISNVEDGNQWFLNGLPITGANNDTLVVPSIGTYCVVASLGLCVSDTSNYIYVGPTGIRESDGTYFSVFPVPNWGLFTARITNKYQENYRIVIYNTLGAIVYQTNEFTVHGQHDEIIDIQTLPSAIYSVVFTSGQKKVVRKVFINK